MRSGDTLESREHACYAPIMHCALWSFVPTLPTEAPGASGKQMLLFGGGVHRDPALRNWSKSGGVTQSDPIRVKVIVGGDRLLGSA